MSNAMASAAGSPHSSSPDLSLSDSSHTPGLDHRHFIKYVMSDVYALIDYLSGRAWPPLDSLLHDARRTQSAHHFGEIAEITGPATNDCEMIKHDLSDNSRLFCRAVKIGKALGTNEDTVSTADAAFLIQVRDYLNARAYPATGGSVSFTIRVIEKLLVRNGRDVGKCHRRYIIPDDELDHAACRLARFVRRCVKISWYVLIATVVLSTYVACGKLLLDTRDAVNRDFQGNLNAITTEAAGLDKLNLHPATDVALPPYPPGQVPDPGLDEFCRQFSAKFSINQVCHQREELKVRKANIYNLLRRWICLWGTIGSDEQVAQWTSTSIAVLGNYLLPVFYGLLGAFGFVLRRLNQQLADYLLTPRVYRASMIRIGLGMMTGACIGLFVNSPPGAATLTGFGGTAVTLSASGIAFLAGYGVEGVFKMLDGLVNLVFRIDENRKTGLHA